MEICLHPICEANLTQVNRVDGSFTVDSRLVLLCSGEVSCAMYWLSIFGKTC